MGPSSEEDESDSGDPIDERTEGDEAERKRQRVEGGSGGNKDRKTKAAVGASSGNVDRSQVFSWKDVLAAVQGQRGDSVKVSAPLCRVYANW